MKYLRVASGVICLLFLSLAPLKVSSEPLAPSLMIRQIKITGEELVFLQATQDIEDLSNYWIGYASNDTINPGSIVPSQQLPARAVRAGQAVLLTSDGGATCDAVMTTKLSATLADSKGTLVIRRFETSGLTSTFTTIDSVSWSKPSGSVTAAAQLDLRKETAGMTSAVWYHDPSFLKPWRVGNLVGCELSLAAVSGTTDSVDIVSWEQHAVEPPAIIENINEEESTSVENAIPGENAGLAPPLITELMPNPMGAGTDASDEFIELYNSNDVAFSLGGFTLQTGLGTKHSYVFPASASIPAKEFITYYSSQTGLSMSNTEGQAQLLDRSKAVVVQTEPYDSAPDGQAWALANGAWYWTAKATPQATNVIDQPLIKAATAAKKLTVKTAAAKSASSKVKAATTKVKKTRTPKATTVKQTTTPAGARQTASIPGPVPIHPGVLAVVVLGAVGYGAYVYRKDLANAFYKLRRH